MHFSLFESTEVFWTIIFVFAKRFTNHAKIYKVEDAFKIEGYNPETKRGSQWASTLKMFFIR